MFAVLIRGFVIFGVVGWYSTSIWKMIDGLFKDQFQRYLEDEYQRNPKMREDVRAYVRVDKTGSEIADNINNHENREETRERILKACGLGEACPAVDEVVVVTTTTTTTSRDESVSAHVDFDVGGKKKAGAVDGSKKKEEEVNEKMWGKEVDVNVVDSNELEFQRKLGYSEEEEEEEDTRETTTMNEREQNQPQAINTNIAEPISTTNEQQEKSQQPQSKSMKSSSNQLKNQSNNENKAKVLEERIKSQVSSGKTQKSEEKSSRKSRKTRTAPLIGAKSEKVTQRVQRRNGPQARNDFVSRKRVIGKNNYDNNNKKDEKENDEEEDEWEEEEEEEEDYKTYDRDFSEFDDDDDDDDEEDREAGENSIAVAELPYRPAVDIYDLDKLSDQEFCPLTLDDDPSCDEARTWP